MTERHRKGWHKMKDGDAPTMTAEAVKEELQFLNKESVHILVRRGPEHGGLPGYIPSSNGRGWIRKTSSGHSGVQVMFFPEDVQYWNSLHPIKGRPEGRRVEYTDTQKEQVLEAAESLKASDGSVKRTHVLRKLTQRFGISKWNTRTYKIIKQVLDDEGYALPPQMPRDTSLRRRSYKVG